MSSYVLPRTPPHAPRAEETDGVSSELSTAWAGVSGGKDAVCRGHFVSVGDQLGRRTTVFRATTRSLDDQLIFKETYRHNGRRLKEEEDIPGIVRLKDWEHVHTGSKPLEIGSGEAFRPKVRLALLYDDEDLREARSVNELLKTFYDVLEGALLSSAWSLLIS
ncbi:hypothetical protein K466DRAFT_600073 [Polyporus arcularius HHB13444]|uniref:Fungal-type protein kinase domain-containing protein n=1 Tax=Polyporus arcularius HHB13444 TaxID=1314778 RepID=A0A5C3PAG3_9APHY|nr:hypothetical protein K466DRAFT_600073 [Polyporus arcularius HHB13444]